MTLGDISRYGNHSLDLAVCSEDGRHRHVPPFWIICSDGVICLESSGFATAYFLHCLAYQWARLLSHEETPALSAIFIASASSSIDHGLNR